MPHKGMHNPASPGELLKEFLGDQSITELAAHIGVARATVSRIINGRTAVTAEMSIRLGQALGLSEDFFAAAQFQRDFWLALQARSKPIKRMAAA